MHLCLTLRLLPLASLLLAGSLLLPSCSDSDKKPAAAQKASKKAAKKKGKKKKKIAPLTETEFQKQFMLLPMEAQIIVHSSLSPEEQAETIRKEVMPKTRAVAAIYSKTEGYRPAGEAGNIMLVAAVKPYDNEEELMAAVTKIGEKYGVDPQKAFSPGNKLTASQQKLVDEVKLACMGIPPSELKMPKPFTPESAALEQKALYRELTAILSGEDSPEKKAAAIDKITARCARLSMALSHDKELFKKTQDALMQDADMTQVLRDIAIERVNNAQKHAEHKPLKIALDHIDNLVIVFRPMGQLLTPLYLR